MYRSKGKKCIYYLALHFLYQNQTDNCEFNKGGQSMMLQFDFAPLESS